MDSQGISVSVTNPGFTAKVDVPAVQVNVTNGKALRAMLAEG